MRIGQVLTMPIFFASNAIYPISLMPAWLKAVSSLNPLIYEVDGLRAAMLRSGMSIYGIANDVAALALAAAIFIVLAALLYPRMTQ